MKTFTRYYSDILGQSLLKWILLKACRLVSEFQPPSNFVKDAFWKVYSFLFFQKILSANSAKKSFGKFDEFAFRVSSWTIGVVKKFSYAWTELPHIV